MMVINSLEISIHALRKESDIEAVESRETHDISIHALRKESDRVRGNAAPVLIISIHALRKESDHPIPRASTRNRHFNPRSP